MVRRANKEGIELTNFFAGGDDTREDLLAEPAQSGGNCDLSCQCAYCGLCYCISKCDCNCFQQCKSNCGLKTTFKVFAGASGGVRQNQNQGDLSQLTAQLAESTMNSIYGPLRSQVSATNPGG